MKKYLVLVLAILVISSVILSACAPKTPTEASEATTVEPQESITLKLGSKMTADSLDGQTYQRFADLVKEKTNGAIVINVYPSEQLGDQPTQINNLKLGVQELYAESGNSLTGLSNLFEVTNIPFLFKDNEQYTEFVKGEFGKQQEAALEQNGLKLLNTNRGWLRGPYRIIGSVKPIKTVEDIKGLRFRSWDSDLYMSAWSILGAKPLVVAWSETYLALQQGTVDSVTTTIDGYRTQKFPEVAKYITDISEMPQEIFCIMNLNVFNKLTKEQQQACIDAANEAAEWSNSQLNSITESHVEEMKAEGCEFFKMDTTKCTEMLMDYYRDLEKKGTLPKGILKTLGYE